jgi:PadR family transcriptional regulator PadR
VEYKWVESTSGPPRKYYKLTDEGQTFLTHLDKTWGELIASTDKIIKSKTADNNTTSK